MTGPSAAAVGEFLTRCVRAGRFPGSCAAWCGPRAVDAMTVCHGVVSIGPGGGRAVCSGTIWDLASLTKPLAVTTLALLMRRDGEWAFDAPLRTVLPEATGSAVGERSLESLLAHTSGLPAWRPVYALADRRPEHALQAVLTVPVRGADNERVEYSCLGYLLLGWALERTAGFGLDELFRRRVTAPLELANELGFLSHSLQAGRPAGGASTPSVERQLTAESGGDPTSVPPSQPGLPDDGNARFLGGVAGNAGLFGSARAAVRLAAEYLPGGGDLLTAAEAELATRPATLGVPGQHRSLGWQLASSDGSSAGRALAPIAFGHTGFTGVSIWTDPVRRLTVGLFAHRHHPVHRGIDLHPVRRTYHALVAP